MLKFVPNAAAKPVAKVLRSAIANAEENFGLNRDELVVVRPLQMKARRAAGGGLARAADSSRFCDAHRI